MMYTDDYLASLVDVAGHLRAAPESARDLETLDAYLATADLRHDLRAAVRRLEARLDDLNR